MDEKTTDMIRLYDSLTASSQTQKLKFLLPFFNGAIQNYLVIYIKCMELRYTLSVFSSQASPCSFLPMGETWDPDKLYKSILPFCNEEEKKQFGQMLSFYHQMESMQEMMNTIQMMQEMFPEGFGSENGDMPDPELLKSLLGL